MFIRAIPLFKLFGFSIKIDLSWIFLAVLVVWSLATGLFPRMLPDAPQQLYLVLGVLGALGLFISIILHELGHAVVARRYGIPISGITLFIFGGVAEMEDEPPNARSELLMAIAGPLMSVVLALIAFALYLAAQALSGPPQVVALLEYLGSINAMLALFNMIPAFPLDGGRVLRACLWAWKKNLRKATRISSSIGAAFGMLLIGLGVLSFIQGYLLTGIWWFMIGNFMRAASQMSYKQLLFRRALEGEPIRRFMKSDLVTVSPGMTLRDWVENFLYKFHYKLYPVVVGERLVGFVTQQQARQAPAEEWDQLSVGEVMHACEPEHIVGPEEDAMHALSKMSSHHHSRLLVVEGNVLLGMVTLKDLLAFLSLKIDLEGERL